MRQRLSTDQLYRKMNRLMREKKLYLKKDLTRADVAREAMTNRTYISRALKGRGLNFAQFVNAYRVEHALELLFEKENAGLSREDIAEMSGFSCADAMNRHIKKSAGSTACALRERVNGD
ncbi:MAG: AraC family transcriptional regulator [Bacteroidales bacterium]|nr:AraC family transcriptional regulator [Bacteroidales bacterium]MBQ1753632.1 AraC family transcriptional regulator [Bacteroidales bacterium]MBQ3743195.1 AraC family transcriptional regulator [Bacteroidales bacterium]MBQ5517255.1 AraC family transcriptional regulator [Bacteroidales bacterium]MBR6869529.1 AraC family transcriptional regulator [Bacteroidales bacterium]